MRHWRVWNNKVLIDHDQQIMVMRLKMKPITIMMRERGAKGGISPHQIGIASTQIAHGHKSLQSKSLNGKIMIYFAARCGPCTYNHPWCALESWPHSNDSGIKFWAIGYSNWVSLSNSQESRSISS